MHPLRFARRSMRSRIRQILGTTACCAALAGCAAAAQPPSRTDDSVTEARRQALERKHLERRPQEETPAATGEIPDVVMQRVREHLAERTGAGADTFETVRAESQVWPDGAMGCPQPGLTYTHAPVQGYWIVLEHNARDYDYRVSRTGTMVLCEAMAIPDPPAR